MQSPGETPSQNESSPVNVDRLPNEATITDVGVDWGDGPGELGRLVVYVDGHYPDATALVPHLTPPVESEYWLAYLDSGFVEAFVDVGVGDPYPVDPNAIRYEDEDGVHYLRRASPQLHHEWDAFSSMLVTVVDDQTARSVALSVADARGIIERHHNQTASIDDGKLPDPIALIEDESAERTRWGVTELGGPGPTHELAPIMRTGLQTDAEWSTLETLIDDMAGSGETEEASASDDDPDSDTTDAITHDIVHDIDSIPELCSDPDLAERGTIDIPDLEFDLSATAEAISDQLDVCKHQFDDTTATAFTVTYSDDDSSPSDDDTASGDSDDVETADSPGADSGSNHRRSEPSGNDGARVTDDSDTGRQRTGGRRRRRRR